MIEKLKTPNVMKFLSRGELKREIESFNNACFSHVEGMWMYFTASKFAVEGIKRELGRKVESVGSTQYRIVMSNNPNNH